MNQFSETILKAVSDYKLLLRKIYSAREAAAKIKELGLKRMQIREADDICREARAGETHRRFGL